MSYLEEIKNYGEDIQDFEMSPFETVSVLQWRSEIENKKNELTLKEKQQLALYDLRLLSNAEKMYKHLLKGYNFPSNEPIEHWWWHLDKVVNGEVLFNAIELKDNYAF